MAGNAEELEEALKKASEAGRQDPDQADIAADDAGGTRLAEGLDAKGEAEAHPS
jgi:hypothetical protein